MKWFLKTPATLAIFASWALGFAAHAQTNTQSYFAELNNLDVRDVAVDSPYTAYGDKNNLNRYGDDGSAAIVEASGMVIWRTVDGVYHPLPNSTYAKPLFVTNSECIVWENALSAGTVDDNGDVVTDPIVTYYRIDSASGALRQFQFHDLGTPIDTPIITTTNVPFMFVATDGNVWRLTSNPLEHQLLGTYGGTLDGLVAASSDGSVVARSGTSLVWIRNDGKIQALTLPTTADVVLDAIRPVDLSASRFVFSFARSNATTLYNYSMDPAGNVLAQAAITIPYPTATPAITGQLLLLPNYVQQGIDPIFVTQETNSPTASSNLCVFRLSGNVATFLYKAVIPAGLGTEAAVARVNVMPGWESIALRDQTNHGIIWLHNGTGYDQWEQTTTTNYTRISRWKNDPVPAWATDPYPNTNDMEWARPLFVTPGEIVVWQNALAPTLPNGSTPPVMIKHYGRSATGVITTTEVKVLVDNTDPNLVLPGRIQGTQVFTPYPFTPSPELWMLETGQARSSNSLRLRRYQLLTPTTADEDGDGIRGGLESAPFYVIPGSFTYDQAVEDAKRRGGHLATISDAAEFSKMQTAIQLWRTSSDSALPKLTVPYPLWTGLTNTGSSWQWTDSSPSTFINQTTNWVAGDSSAPYGRTIGRLTLSNLSDPNSTPQWEAANRTNLTVNGGGYLLELTPTDPKAKDTDGDYASDYDELFRLITDPQVDNFYAPSTSSATVQFGSAAVMGNYEGFLTEYGRGPVASFTLSVTKSGSYSGRINGASGSAIIRGRFAANGQVIDLPVSMGNGLSADLTMWIAPDAKSSIYRINGRFNGTTGAPLVFELRRAARSKTEVTPDAGSYTLAIPASTVPKTGMPSGDGYLTGTISKDGKAKFRGFTADGVAVSWSGNLLEGEFMSFFSMVKKSQGFIGSNLFLRDTALYDYDYGLIGESDIDGDLLVVRNQSTGVAGYSYHSGAYGSLYQPVNYNQLPAFSDYIVGSSNALLTFVDGAFSGQNVIATWGTNNTLTLPKTQTRSLSARINKSTGELTGTYTYNDPASNYATSKGKLGAVVLQKSGEVRGYYGVSDTYGQLVMLPNIDGSQAPVTLISPRSKTGISENGTTYKLYLTTSEPWQVVNSNSWIIVQPTSGTGSAVLTVTVAGNFTNLRREADIVIAGLTHHVAQEWNRQTNGSSVTISPVAKTLSYLGGSYTVQVTGLSAGSTAPFVSDVPWVTVTPSADLKSATVVVLEYDTLGNDPRTAVITIAGLPHTIVQSAWYYWYWY